MLLSSLDKHDGRRRMTATSLFKRGGIAGQGFERTLCDNRSYRAEVYIVSFVKFLAHLIVKKPTR
jgi:hypothetical protein